jgi:hypothetical protein
MSGEERAGGDTLADVTRDVKWICHTLERIEKQDRELEVRVRSLERWRALQTGEDRRGRASGALLGGFLGGVVAVLARIWWG